MSARRSASRTPSNAIIQGHEVTVQQLKSVGEAMAELGSTSVWKKIELGALMSNEFTRGEMDFLLEQLEKMKGVVAEASEKVSPKKGKQKKKTHMVGKDEIVLAIMKRATMEWEKFRSGKSFDTFVKELELPQIHSEMNNDELASAYRKIEETENTLSYLLGYCSYMKGQLCVMYRDRVQKQRAESGQKKMTQKQLFPELQKILGVTTPRTIANYFAYYALISFAPIFVFLPARDVYQFAGAIKTHLQDEKFLDRTFDYTGEKIKMWLVSKNITLPAIQIKADVTTEELYPFNNGEVQIYQGVSYNTQYQGNAPLEMRDEFAEGEWVNDVYLANNVNCDYEMDENEYLFEEDDEDSLSENLTKVHFKN